MYFLDSLVPNNNAYATNVALQNTIFDKVTQCVSVARSKNQNEPITGYATGDLDPNTDIWIAGFGRLAKQEQVDMNVGYRSKALGFLIGIDRKYTDDDIYGLAVGVANNNVFESSNSNYATQIFNINAMLYGLVSITDSRYVISYNSNLAIIMNNVSDTMIILEI